MPSERLTALQRRRVRELMQDERQTREEAATWVLAFEPEPTPAETTSVFVSRDVYDELLRTMRVRR